MARIYGEVADGKVLEIQNWRERGSTGGAVVMQPLNDGQAGTFRELRARGMDDEQIWNRLHPDQVGRAETEQQGSTLRQLKPESEPEPVAKSRELSFRLDELPKPQLVWIIESLMQQKAETLNAMSHADLLNLARFATKGRRVHLSFEP